MLWLLATLTILLYFYLSVRKRHSYWSKRGIKHVKPKFFFGSMEILRSKSFPEKVQEIYNEFPGERYHGVYLFLQPVLMIKDPDLLKRITVKDFDRFLNHTINVSSNSDPFWSKNLFASRDDRWRRLRITLSPSFTGHKMRTMYALIDECALQFVRFFDQKPFVELEVKDALSRYTNDVIATTAFGLKCDSLANRQNEFFSMGKKASDFGGLRSLKFFVYSLAPTLSELLQIKIIPESVTDYFSKIIKNTVEVRRAKNIVRPDMINLLLQAQQDGAGDITLEDITSQAFIFFMAGFETVSTLLSFTFYELAINPDIQNRLRKEMSGVEEPISYDTLTSFKYLDMVMAETLRKWPPIVATDRQVSKETIIEPSKPGEIPVRLEEGVTCWLPIYALHHDPAYFPEPEKFDPERFGEERRHQINWAAYMPFGAGPRNCIGSRFALLESKLLIYYVLKTFEIVPVKKTRVPMVIDKRQVNLTAQDGVWIGLKKL